MPELSARLGFVSGKGGSRASSKESFPRWTLYVAGRARRRGERVQHRCGHRGDGRRDPAAGACAVRPDRHPRDPGCVSPSSSCPYHRYAKVLRWLTLSLAAYVAVLFVVGVDWAAAFRTTVLPPLAPDVEVAALIAIFGDDLSYLPVLLAGDEEVEEGPRGDGRRPGRVSAAPRAHPQHAHRRRLRHGIGGDRDAGDHGLDRGGAKNAPRHADRDGRAGRRGRCGRSRGASRSCCFFPRHRGNGTARRPGARRVRRIHALTEAVGGPEGLNRPLRRAPTLPHRDRRRDADRPRARLRPGSTPCACCSTRPY